MGYAYELKTLTGLPKQAWLFDCNEQNRWREIIAQWKKENPSATIEKQLLIEGLVRCHLWEQRLIDRRRFWNGEPTDYKVIAGHKQADLSDEDNAKKENEWLKYMPFIQRWKMDYLKLALANSIDVQLTGDISSLFSAMDEAERMKIHQYKGKDAKA